jgi:hypothetical protein
MDFVDRNVECNFYTFIRPNQDQCKNATIVPLAGYDVGY